MYEIHTIVTACITHGELSEVQCDVMRHKYSQSASNRLPAFNHSADGPIRRGLQSVAA
jgi:hypothetical protein